MRSTLFIHPRFKPDDRSTLTSVSASFDCVGFNSIFILERENGIMFFIESNPTIIFLLMRKNFSVFSDAFICFKE